MAIAVVRQAARRLSAEAAIQLPVDLAELLKWRGLSLRVETDWPAELCARYYPAERAIYVNGKHVRVRQRFSVAHELGHFVLGHEELEVEHGITAIFGDEDESYKVEGDLEREANAFATELLMPAKWVKLQASGVVAKDLSRIIEKGCDVSAPAAWYRIMELRLAEFAPAQRRKPRLRR